MSEAGRPARRLRDPVDTNDRRTVRVVTLAIHFSAPAPVPDPVALR